MEKLSKDLYIKNMGEGRERRGAICFELFFCRYYKSELNNELFIFLIVPVLDIFPLYVYTEIRQFGLKTTFLFEYWTLSGF